MRIRQRTPRLLTIRSGSPGAWVFGALFVTVGFALWLYRPALMCDRGSGMCTLGAYDLPGSSQQAIPMLEIREAAVATRDSGDGQTRASVVLETQEGSIPFAEGWVSGEDRAERTAERINAFLAGDGTDELRVSSASASAASALFAGLGVLIVGFGASLRSLVLDRESNRYSIVTRRPLLPSARSDGELSEITGTLEWRRESSGSSRTVLGLIDARAQFHPLKKGGIASRRLRRAALRICEFLELGESAAVDSSPFRIGPGETLRLLRGVEAHAEEAEGLRARLQEDPGDIEGFRQLAIRLVRLERRAEAATILRNAHRHHLEQGNRDQANRLTGILTVLGL